MTDGESREVFEPPRGARRAWIVAASVFLLSIALPWTSCNDMSPATAGLLYLAGSHWQGQLIGVALVIAPVLAVFALTITDARGRWKFPAQMFALAALACALAVGVGTHGDGERWVLDAWPEHSRWALRVMLLAPPAALGAWAFAARAEDGLPFGARWLTSFAAVGSTLVWSIFGDRYGFWLGALGAVGMLSIAPMVLTNGTSPIGLRGRRVLLALTVFWLVIAVVIHMDVRRHHRPPSFGVTGAQSTTGGPSP